MNADGGDGYPAFRDWALTRTKFDDSGDIFPVTHFFYGILWTGSTVRKQWRLISGNKLFAATGAAATDLSTGLPREIAGSNDLPRSVYPNLSVVVADPTMDSMPSDTIVITSRTKGSEQKQQDSSYSSSRDRANALINLDVEHSAVDWTARQPQGALSAHAEFARSIDWSGTPLGAMKTWGPEFKQIANLMMKSPHAVALVWGSDLTMLYNEAHRDVVAIRKHPGLMGSGFRGPFSETWDDLADLFEECARTGNSVSMENQQLPMVRQGFMEETYFTWSLTPLYGSGKKVLGFYNAPFETTRQCMSERRARTLLRLREETSNARTISEFWKAVLCGLEANHYDIPVAILYSVVDADDGESSAVSGSSISFKSCQLEGTLGVPPGHYAAPNRLDLKRSTEGFVPSFREAMRTREPTTLQSQDETLPSSLIADLEWRGWGEPCREAIIFPVRPTPGESVLAFLLIGINPRPPYDDSYRSFVNMLNHQLATSLASLMLFEDEIRRGRAEAEAAAKEREQLSQQLAEQTLRMKQMALASRVGMYYLTPRGVLLEANDGFYDMLGFSRTDHRELAFMEIAHPDSLAQVHEAWTAYTIRETSWSGEWRLHKPWVDESNGEVLELDTCNRTTGVQPRQNDAV